MCLKYKTPMNCLFGCFLTPTFSQEVWLFLVLGQKEAIFSSQPSGLQEAAAAGDSSLLSAQVILQGSGCQDQGERGEKEGKSWG